MNPQTPLVCPTSGLCWPSIPPSTLLPANLSSSLFPTVAGASATNGGGGLSGNTQAVNMAMLAAAMRGCQNPAFLAFLGNQANFYATQGLSPTLTQIALQSDPCLASFSSLYQLPPSSNSAALLSNDLLSLSSGGGIPSSFLVTSAQQQQAYTTPALYAAAMAATARQNLPLASFTDQLSLSIDRSSTATSSASTAGAGAANSVATYSNGTHLTGRKREASSTDGVPSADTFMPWLPPKRALKSDEPPENHTSPMSCPNRPDAYSMQNQNKPSETVIASVPLSFGTSSTSNVFGYPMVSTSIVQSPYCGYGQPDVTNQLVNALAFSNLLQQQNQQQQQQRLSLQDLNHPVGGGLQLGVNQIPSNGAASALSFPQLHQQQFYLNLLRLQALAQQQQQQQAQLTALAVATGGYSLPTHPAQLSNLVSGLTAGVFPTNPTDPRLQTAAAAAAISANPYSANLLQNQSILTNVAYINDEGQMLESLPICRDFKAGKCHRNADCRYVHILDENVEVNQGRVTVCRDAAKGRCTRVPCKYYHIPLLAISASRSLALNSALSTSGIGTTSL